MKTLAVASLSDVMVVSEYVDEVDCSETVLVQCNVISSVWARFGSS